jgi:hypothetical protein
MTTGDFQHLRELEGQFILGCRNWYLLRVWERHGSFESSTVAERIRVAELVLATEGRGGVAWAQGGWLRLIDHLIGRLNDNDPHIRGEAAIALGDLRSGWAIPVLLERIQSREVTPHDRACAAWALGRIGRGRNDVVSVLLKVMEQSADSTEADELRRCAAEAAQAIVDNGEVLFAFARLCLADSYYKCKLIGLDLTERLGERRAELLPLIELLIRHEIDAVAALARKTLTGLI